MSILDPSYMIDLGGIDVIQSQGVAIPGLYQKLLDNIGPCGNPLIYNWKFNGVFIPPQFVEPILEDDAIYINDIYVSSDDVVHIPSIERHPVTVQLNVSENGEYEVPEGVDGYNPVVVDVGPVGPVFSGVTAPDADLGSNEDLYVQYEVMSALYDHTFRIVAEYRKVNGLWEPYTEPVLPTIGFHVWTKSTGGTDAAMYVQAGYWDTINNIFVATGEIESVLYTTVRTWANAKNCNGIALLAYPNNWQIKATVTITDGTTVYQPDADVATWGYNVSYDNYFWRLPN